MVAGADQPCDRSPVGAEELGVMRVRSWSLLTLLVSFVALPAFAQSQPANTVRTLLAAGRIGSVVETPLHFWLFRVALPAADRVSYNGLNSMLYVLSGTLSVSLDGTAQTIPEGAGVFIRASQEARLGVAGAEPAQFLHFVLAPAAEGQKPVIGSPARAEELYRTGEPLPGLRSGPYEFSLTRVVLPAAMPPNPTHYRTGAAMYYILSGTGTFMADGKAEPRAPGMPHFEPYGWAHQWANPGETPLVILQANISQEGVPAIILGIPPSASK
jgi:mannose-6-phosphate isomerase-like protein (cupin superfamily)